MTNDSRYPVERALVLSLVGWCCTAATLFAQTGASGLAPTAAPVLMEPIRVSDDQTHFVQASSLERFVIWGVNYDHDSDGRLLDEYWIDEWDTVVDDFQEIKELGANCVRVHLQLGKFMDTPSQPNERALQQLSKLVQLAETTGLYLDVTGLACYHKHNIHRGTTHLMRHNDGRSRRRFGEPLPRRVHRAPPCFVMT